MTYNPSMEVSFEIRWLVRKEKSLPMHLNEAPEIYLHHFTYSSAKNFAESGSPVASCINASHRRLAPGAKTFVFK